MCWQTMLSALLIFATQCPLPPPTHGAACFNETRVCTYNLVCCKKNCSNLTVAECGISKKWLLLHESCSFIENFELTVTSHLDIIVACVSLCACLLLCCCFCKGRTEEPSLRVVAASSQIVSADELQKLVPVAAAAARHEAFASSQNVYFTPL